MKILTVNCVYRKGSTGKIVNDIKNGLVADGHEVVVCYGRGERTDDHGVYKTSGELYSKLNNLSSRFTGVMYGGCRFSTARLISVIKKESPDVVHLHCINGYFVNIYKLVTWLKENKIPTVLTLHAEFMHTGGCSHAFECEKWAQDPGCGSCHRRKDATKSIFLDGTRRMWTKMRGAFDGFDKGLCVVSVSPWLAERAGRSPILAGKDHVVVKNGVDTGVFHPVPTERDGDVTTVFHATAHFSASPDHSKGGYYLLELARALKDQPVRFIVAGDHSQIDDIPENVTLLGEVSDQSRLAEYYSAADLTLLTSKRETFSMVTAESLCCGTPVIGFRAGGPEGIAIPEYSRFVDFGDVEGLKDAFFALRGLKNEVGAQKIAARSFAEYDSSVMYAEYLKIYENLVKEDYGR